MDAVERQVHAVDPHAKVIPFGSFALRAQLRHSDIDVLVTTTRARDEFFDQFERTLTDTESVTDLIIVRDTFVPVIKFHIGHVQYDVVVACVDGNDCWREDVDRRAMSALNVVHTILRIVQPFADEYAASLTLVKQWADDQLVYSNTLGLLNGVGLAILTAWLMKHTHVRSPADVLDAMHKLILRFPFETHTIDLLDPVPAPTVVSGKYMTVLIPGEKINTFHNVGRAQFECIRRAARRSVESPHIRPVEAFLSEHGFFLHIHMFTPHGRHAPFRAEVLAKIKTLIKSLEPVRAHPLPHTWTFQSERHVRTSVFIAFYEMPSLQTVSEFFVKFVHVDCRICTDVLSASKLPAFFYELTDPRVDLL